MVYHADRSYLRGGFLGVDIFFVLSGFLISAILLAEISTSGTIDRARFYIRRIRRIFPALLALLLISSFAVGFIASDSAYAFRRDLPWALSFVLNLSYIFFDQSYFVNISRPPLLQHLWSLAIEEQFYIIWPLLLLVISRFKKFLLRPLTFLAASILGIASTVWMAYLAIRSGYPLPNDPSRLYFGTDTHATGLLIGCALAAALRPDKLRNTVTADRRAALNILGLLSTFALAASLIFVDEFSPFLYRGGFLIFSLITATLIVVLVHPGLRWNFAFGNPLLLWFGRRSYGMYIWHWPIFMLLRPGIDVALPDQITQLLRLVILLFISDISYRYLEMPVRQGKLNSVLHNWRVNGVPRPNLITGTALFTLILAIVFNGVQIVRAPDVSAANVSAFGGVISVDEDPVLALNNNADPTIPRVQPVLDIKPVVFGDSVVLGAREKLKSVLGLISIDAKVGRQPREIAERIEIRRSEHRLGDFVIIHMGTNGVVTEKDLRPILERLSDRKRVVVVNVRVPRPWMKPTNSMIQSIIVDYPNVRLADWNKASKNHRGYFGPDGVHLTGTGGQAFAELIEQVLTQP